MPDDTDFLFFADELWEAAGFSKASRERKLQRFIEGRALYAGTEEDFDAPGYDLLIGSIEEGDDVCIYQTRKLFRQAATQSKQEKQISTLVQSALRFQAAAERRINQAIRIAQRVTGQCDERCAALSVTSADGHCVRSGTDKEYDRIATELMEAYFPSGMARYANWLNGSESELFDRGNDYEI